MTAAGCLPWTVIVASRNRPRALADCVERLLQSETGHDWELIVVDQSEEMAGSGRADVPGDPRIRYFRQDGKGKSRALNLALREARGETLAFTDDDCLVAPEWLEGGCRALEASPRLALLFGQMIPAPHDPAEEFIPAMEFTGQREYQGRRWLSRGLIGMGGSMFARRSALLEVGGFDEDLGPGGPLRTGEECELAFRLLRRGYRLARRPEPVVLHAGARPVAGGEAARLVNDGFYAIAAGYGKNAARGDWVAAVAAGHELTRVVSAGASAVVRRRPPYHWRRLVMNVSGFRDGWSAGRRYRQAAG